MRIMALDVGTKRIGVALTDPLGMLAQPYTTVNRTDDKGTAEVIVDLLQEKNVVELVVGLPRRTDGSEGPEVQQVRQFVDCITEKWPGPVVWYDERLTTAGAEQVLVAADVSRAKRKKVVDQLAASLILQGYLEYKRFEAGKTSFSENEE